MEIDQKILKDTYNRLAQASALPGVPDYYVKMTQLFDANEIWKDYIDVLRLAPSFEGGVVADIGCKYGHVLPLFHAMGAKSSIGVDVDDEYLRVGNAAFEAIGFPARLVKSDEAYLPIDSDSVDFVLVNEVISHVNPAYLDTLYAEIVRILKVGGTVLIADGNNRANASCVADLNQLFMAWEKGPTGTNTGRDIVDAPYLNLRKQIITSLHPQLTGNELNYLAENTSGLFGERLEIEVSKYMRGEGWVPRPYRPGVCPTNPGPGGVVMERAFHPIQVELTLAEFGIQARQVYPRSKIDRASIRGLLGPWLYNLKLALTE